MTRTLGIVLALLIVPAARAAPTGTLNDVEFSEYTPLSSNTELARRMLTPLTTAQIPQLLAQSGKSLTAQPVNLTEERFSLYVPSHVPTKGYALLVFVPPWNTANLPDDWTPILEHYGVILVSAARSGNDQSVLGRREPLALLAEQNVAHRYPVDPGRIFIAGFSGGSRVAMRLALGYPDVFRGAILNAGSDPIGDSAIPLPPKDLFHRFQDSGHIVFVTGSEDSSHVVGDLASAHSLRDWCMFNVEKHSFAFASHELITSAALSWALDTLLNPAQPDPARLAACRSGIESDLDAKLQEVRSLIAAGQGDSARDRLKEIDTQYGGLAAPQSVELAAKLARKN